MSQRPSVGTTKRSACSADLRLNLVRLLVPNENQAFNHWAYWDWREILEGMTPEEIKEAYETEALENYEEPEGTVGDLG